MLLQTLTRPEDRVGVSQGAVDLLFPRQARGAGARASTCRRASRPATLSDVAGLCGKSSSWSAPVPIPAPGRHGPAFSTANGVTSSADDDAVPSLAALEQIRPRLQLRFARRARSGGSSRAAGASTGEADLVPVETDRPKVKIMTMHASQGAGVPDRLSSPAASPDAQPGRQGPMSYRRRSGPCITSICGPKDDAKQRVNAERLSEQRRSAVRGVDPTDLQVVRAEDKEADAQLADARPGRHHPRAGAGTSVPRQAGSADRGSSLRRSLAVAVP